MKLLVNWTTPNYCSVVCLRLKHSLFTIDVWNNKTDNPFRLISCNSCTLETAIILLNVWFNLNIITRNVTGDEVRRAFGKCDERMGILMGTHERSENYIFHSIFIFILPWGGIFYNILSRTRPEPVPPARPSFPTWAFEKLSSWWIM